MTAPWFGSEGFDPMVVARIAADLRCRWLVFGNRHQFIVVDKLIRQLLSEVSQQPGVNPRGIDQVYRARMRQNKHQMGINKLNKMRRGAEDGAS